MSTTQKTLVLLSVVGLFLLVYLLKPILAPFLVGLLIAYLGDPLVDRLEAMGLKRTAAVCVVFLVFGLLFTGVVLILVPMLGREIASFIREIPTFIKWLQDAISPYLTDVLGVNPFDIQTDELKQSLMTNWQQAGGIVGRVITEMTRSSVVLVTWIANIGLIPIVAFYLLRDWDLLMQRIREMLPRQAETRTVTLATECDEVLHAFFRGQLLIMFILGCTYALGLWIIGLDLAVLIGMLAGLASIVPYMGFIVGIAAAALAALFQFQDVMPLVYVVLVFGAGQALEGWFLTPLLVGDRIGLHPVAVIFAILAGGQLFGFVGVLLALPVAAVIMVFLRDLHARYKESELFDSDKDGA
jgi:predicted PurR-regulated permease PerM|tara:strand:+ start:9865 stop:10932 length:1068 start_codon:yes stop_codon:yes gene_type:complete